MLRFRTKRQHAEFKKIAKDARFSLNEYILRILEDKHSDPIKPQEQQPVHN